MNETEKIEPLEAEDRIAHLLKLASKATARALQDRLAMRGVSYAHWTLLRILWQRDGLTVTELASLAGVAKPAVATGVQSMEKLGYVRRGQRDGNLKAVYIHLTLAGRALEEMLVPYAMEVNELALRGIPENQQLGLRSQLVRIIRNLEEARE